MKKAPEEVVTTPEEIRETLFGAGSNTEALIAEYEGTSSAMPCSSPAIQPGSDATGSIWKTCTFPQSIAVKAREERY